MSEEKVLTKEIAEQFLVDEESVDLTEFTAIEDVAAGLLGTYPNTDGCIFLLRVNNLSVNAAKGLAKYGGTLDLTIDNFSDEVIAELVKAPATGFLFLNSACPLRRETAQILANHEGFLCLASVDTLDEDVAVCLADKLGALDLGGLETIDARTSEILSAYKGDMLIFSNLIELSSECANNLSKYKGWLGLRALPRLSENAARALGQKSEGVVDLSGLVSLGVAERVFLEQSAAEIQADFDNLPFDDYDD